VHAPSVCLDRYLLAGLRRIAREDGLQRSDILREHAEMHDVVRSARFDELDSRTPRTI
jgi:hypothetical protein